MADPGGAASTGRRPVEWWVLQIPDPLLAEATSPGLEADGWDGVSYGDNQCRVGDPILTMALAVKATERLRFTTGCTNAVTRHETVLAASWAHLQEISGGRVMLGLGRGDSALADIGLAMQPVKQFEQSVRKLRALCNGEAVSLDTSGGRNGIPGIDSLGYANTNAVSRLEWFNPDLHRVPLDLTVSGPKSIGVAARHADRVTFSVGAQPERIAWAIGLCRDEAEKAGRDPDSIDYAVHVQLMCDDDRQNVLQLGKSIVALHARLQRNGPVSDADREVIGKLSENYDITVHGTGGAQAELISDEFAQRFAVFGPPEDCIEQLRGVVDTGVDAIVVDGAVLAGTVERRRENLARIAAEIIPAFRDLPAPV